MADKLTAATTADPFDDVDEQDAETLAPGDDTQGYTDDSSVPNDPKKGGKRGGGNKGGGNKGTIIGISVAVGVAVVLAVGYFSFVKKEPPAKAKAVTKKAPVQEALPIAVAPTPMAPVVANATPESKTAEDFLTRGNAAPLAVINDVAIEVVKQEPVVPVQAPVLNVPTQPFIPSVPTVPVEPTVVPVDIFAPTQELAQIPTNVPVIPNAPMAMEQVVPATETVAPVVNQVEAPARVQDTSINSAFDSIATRVDSVSTRVDGLEKFKAAQEDLNSQFEKRIDRLEGFHEGDKACNCDNSSKNASTGTVAPKKVTKPAAKPASEKRVAPKPKPVAKPKTNIDGDLMVDNTRVRVPAAKKPAPLEEYQFHSIYDHRVWLKNPDGSLSTFTVGNKLPSGEIIKEVSHETFEVVTDKRTIRKN